LALRQVEEVRRLFPHVAFEVKTYRTLGDRDRVTPLSDVEGTDFFTREIDEALLRGEIDIALHSSKDFPEVVPCGLNVILETAPLSKNDCLVAKNNFLLKDLPPKSRIGTSSRRRKEQIRFMRPDLTVVDIRGNIEERLTLLDSGKLDALIVAHAALIRLGLEGRVSEVFHLKDFPTHPKQGRLSLAINKERWQELKFILSEQAPAIRN